MWNLKIITTRIISRYICFTCEKLRFLLYVYYEIEDNASKGYIKNKMEKDKFAGTVEEYCEKIEKERKK